MFSGLMLSQYTADSLIGARILSLPLIDRSGCADQRFVPWLNRRSRMPDPGQRYGVLGIECMQRAALDSGISSRRGVKKAHEVVRSRSPSW